MRCASPDVYSAFAKLLSMVDGCSFAAQQVLAPIAITYFGAAHSARLPERILPHNLGYGWLRKDTTPSGMAF